MPRYEVVLYYLCRRSFLVNAKDEQDAETKAKGLPDTELVIERERFVTADVTRIPCPSHRRKEPAS